MNIPERIAAIDPRTRTAIYEGCAVLLVLALTYFIGCEHGKSLVTAPASLGEVQTHESWHADTSTHPLTTSDHGTFKATGEKLASGKVAFHPRVKTENGETSIDATYDPAENTLEGSFVNVITVRVPEIVLTHTVQSFLPIETKTSDKSRTSPWTWAEVGAVIGGLITFAALLFFHVSL